MKPPPQKKKIKRTWSKTQFTILFCWQCYVQAKVRIRQNNWDPDGSSWFFSVLYYVYSILVCTGIFKLFSNFILAGGLAVDLSFLSYQSISVFFCLIVPLPKTRIYNTGTGIFYKCIFPFGYCIETSDWLMVGQNSRKMEIASMNVN